MATAASEIFVTYDLSASSSAALPVDLPGKLLGFEIGIFRGAEGRRSHGVRFAYEHPDLAAESSFIVELPAAATNVQVRFGLLPVKYERALLRREPVQVEQAGAPAAGVPAAVKDKGLS